MKPQQSETKSAANAGLEVWLETVMRKAASLRFGVVQIIAHESPIEQIEKTERIRFGTVGLESELRQADDGAGAGSRARFKNIAWQVAGSYFLTGENNSCEPVSPRKSFNLANGEWGAWEITGRVGVLDVDNAAFPVFAAPAQSATRASSWGVGVNWHLNAT